MNSKNKVKYTGFGNYCSAEQFLVRPERLDDVRAAVLETRLGKVVARGLGRSYGDASLNASNAVISMERLNRFLDLDINARTIRVEAGVKIVDVMRITSRQRLMLPVVPGLSDITVGGCAAFDVHTKNHWHSGGFGDWVTSFRMLLASGEIIECSRVSNQEIFFATLGGMGLTGVIIDLDLKLDKLHGTQVVNHATSVNDLDHLLETFQHATATSTHAVVWLDLLNSKVPNGVVIASSIIEDEGADVMALYKPKIKKPLRLISPFYNKFSNKLFNLLFSAKYKATPKYTCSLDAFLFPWDALSNWNNLYGKAGFVEYQCCIPMKNGREGLAKILSTVLANKSSYPAYFAAIKRMRDGVGMLSFPVDGYSLLLDFPIKDGLWAFLDKLDQIVVGYGGRVYLAKDGRLSASAFADMYPLRNEWIRVREAVDPNNRFASDMGRRLNLSNT